MFSPADEVKVDVEGGRLYEHGWQSWSPTTTYRLTETSIRPEQQWQHLNRFRPETPAPERGFQAEGLMVLDPGTGGPVRVYAAAEPAMTVPSIRAELVGGNLVVSADGPITTEEVPGDLQTALASFGERCAALLGADTPRIPPTVWCSWYHYYLDATQDDILENVASITEHALPVDVIQIDGGWEAGVGDWLGLSGRFSSLTDLAKRIHDSGHRAGIWLAPFTVGSESELARDHPDWLVGKGGRNWDQRMHGLDLTHPGARDYLREVFGQLVASGYDYFKLDFLYTGALGGRRYDDDASPVVAYRSGLELIRDAVGPEAYILGCGAPILPSVGLVDAMRVSADTYNPTDVEPGMRRLRGEQATVARAWQHGRFWVNDADCMIARPSFAMRREWAAVIQEYGGLRSFSDRVADLDEWGMEMVRQLLSTTPPPTPFAVKTGR